MFRISFFYLLLYVPYMQIFNKKYMLDTATGAKLG